MEREKDRHAEHPELSSVDFTASLRLTLLLEGLCRDDRVGCIHHMKLLASVRTEYFWKEGRKLLKVKNSRGSRYPLRYLRV